MRAQAVAATPTRRRTAAAARSAATAWSLWGGLAVVVVIAIIVAVVASGGGDDSRRARPSSRPRRSRSTARRCREYDSDEVARPRASARPSPRSRAVGRSTATPVTRSTPTRQAAGGACSSPTGARTARPRCRGSSTLAKQGVFDGVDVTAVATGTNADAPNYPPSAWLKGEKWPFPVMADSPSGTAAHGLRAHRVSRTSCW